MPEQEEEEECGDERGGGGAEESAGQIGAGVAASFLAPPLLLCKSPGACGFLTDVVVVVVEEVGLARREQQPGVRSLVDASAASRCH